jgi:hypothetical protein
LRPELSLVGFQRAVDQDFHMEAGVFGVVVAVALNFEQAVSAAGGTGTGAALSELKKGKISKVTTRSRSLGKTVCLVGSQLISEILGVASFLGFTS